MKKKLKINHYLNTLLVIRTPLIFTLAGIGIFLGGLHQKPLYALKLRVEIINETKNNVKQKVEKVNLLKLQGGMQVIKSYENAGPTLIVDTREETGNFPFMLQGIYQGVNYNKMIPPNTKENTKVQIKVFESNNVYKNIGLRILYVVRYVNNNLRFLTLYRFDNHSKYTFLEKAQGNSTGRGIYAFLPDNAKNINSSVSVGSGLSNINWLKLNPQKITQKDNTVLIPYPLKPGNRIYQLSYELPYNGKEIKIPIGSSYPLAGHPELLLETKDLDITIPEKTNWEAKKNTLKNTPDEASQLKGSLLKLPDFSGTIHLLFKGGTAYQEETTSTSETGEVMITSALSYQEKAIYSVLGFIIFALATFYIKNKPIWLTKFWLKQKSLLEYQLNALNNKNSLEYQKIKENLQKRLKTINQKIG